MSQNKHSKWLIVGAIYGFIAVAMGAFGAHALEEVLSDHYANVYETASKYALIHAVLITTLSIIPDSPVPKICLWFFTIGLFIFSGTLWVLSITEIKWLGAITPIGGVFLLLGWIRLAWWGVQSNK